ncbi:hypothetical protein V8C34DRAFT_72795 [Trichoderma compactum]
MQYEYRHCPRTAIPITPGLQVPASNALCHHRPSQSPATPNPSNPDNATGPKTRHIAANPAFSPCFDFDRLLVGLVANPKRTLLDTINATFSAGALLRPQHVIASRFQMENDACFAEAAVCWGFGN